MTIQKLLLPVLLLSLAATAVSASGNPESSEDRGRPPKRGGLSGVKPGEASLIPAEAEEYGGIYIKIDDIFPALISEDGSTWYLLLEYPLTENILPKDGTEMLVKAVPSPEYPDRLQVFYAEVDGDPIEPETHHRKRPKGSQSERQRQSGGSGTV